VGSHVVFVLAVDKHHIIGIAGMVVGVALAGFGVFRIARRLSGAALIVAAGITVAVIAALVYTHTIRA
jgi:hypothetical protein